MSLEMRSASANLREVAKRAEQGGYPKRAEWLLQQAEAFDREAALLEKANGPKYFLPQEEQPEAPSVPATISEATSASSLVEQLREEYKAKLGKETILPQPRPELLEMHKILTAERFNVDPIVYLEKGKVTYALLDRSVRPPYNGGLQLFEDDGFVPILERGRAGVSIKIESWTKHVPTKSRFGVSWSEAHDYVAKEVVNVSPHLAKLVKTTGTQFRVPTKKEFQFAGRLRYAHFGEANTWEWLFDNSGFDDRLFGGNSDDGGLQAVGDLHPVIHHAHIAFRLQAVLPSQKA